jgi:DNA (cytosine-5)-methyltransferase 1
MKHLDLFSGIGGFALTAKWCWGDEYENVGHSEIEEFPCKVYHKHFPESRCLGDITKIEWKEGQAELITGGFPCQPHSQAGLKRGSKDERDLWSECIRAISRIRPGYALFENVSELLKTEQGRFFNRVLSDLAKERYDVQWQIIPACEIGAPHTRKKLWIMAYSVSIGQKKNVEFFSQYIKNERINTRTWNKRRMDKPEIERVVDGIPRQLDRLAAIGNAIVPQVAYEIFKRIKEVDNATQH